MHFLSTFFIISLITIALGIPFYPTANARNPTAFMSISDIRHANNLGLGATNFPREKACEKATGENCKDVFGFNLDYDILSADETVFVLDASRKAVYDAKVLTATNKDLARDQAKLDLKSIVGVGNWGNLNAVQQKKALRDVILLLVNE